MIDLYLVFFLVGGILFAGITWYSMLLQRGRNQPHKEDYVDPLFAELEENKAKQKEAVAKIGQAPQTSPVDNSDSTVDEGVVKQEPSLHDPGNIRESAAQSALQSTPQKVTQEDIEPPVIDVPNRDFLPVIEESLPDKFVTIKIEPGVDKTKTVTPQVDAASMAPAMAPKFNDKTDQVREDNFATIEPDVSDATTAQLESVNSDTKADMAKPVEVERELDEPKLTQTTLSETDSTNTETEPQRLEPQQSEPQQSEPQQSEPQQSEPQQSKPQQSKPQHKHSKSTQSPETSSSELPSLSNATAARPKAKSFTQKLAEKVARRTAAKKPKPTVSKKPTIQTSKTATPAPQQTPATPSRRATPAASNQSKLGKQSSSIVTELVARVKNPEPIEQQDLLALFRTHDFKFHRKVHIYGLNQLTDLWRDIEFELPSARFVELGVSIQLADRDGAMTEKELHDFQQMTLEFSNSFDAPFEFSLDIDEALKQAQLLDQIGRRYDSMAVLNVVPKSKSGFRMADIESCARDLMMSTDKNGIFMKTQGRKHDVSVLYRLACTDGSGHFGLSSGAVGAVHDLVVYMNVPATGDPESVFQQMVKDAKSLATWLEGNVVDRTGRSMSQRSYSVLMQQISDIAFSMQQDGLIPGDEISKKLF